MDLLITNLQLLSLVTSHMMSRAGGCLNADSCCYKSVQLDAMKVLKYPRYFNTCTITSQKEEGCRPPAFVQQQVQLHLHMSRLLILANAIRCQLPAEWRQSIGLQVVAQALCVTSILLQ